MKLTFSVVALAVSLAEGARAQCPDFTTYSQSPQGNPSSGPLKLPYMRPSPGPSSSSTPSTEKVIVDMKARLKDPDIARLFENTFPNTLDTTVKYFNSFATYVPLLSVDPSLATLMKAVINNEARYVSQYPYCGSFQPPPESGLAPSLNSHAVGVTVNPPVNNQTVFECKYEIDSLCGFLKLSRSYYGATKDASFMNDNWYAAVNQIFRVINEQSQGSFDANFNFISYYNWTGGNGALSPAVDNGGNGEPKAYTGMVGTHHRPSDDLSVFAFLTPANAMLSVELSHLNDILTQSGQAKSGQGKNISTQATTWSKRVSDAVWANTLVDNIFAYETNGLGSRYVMDDANTHPAYVATRKVLLSRGNPYFAQGKNFSGAGGPHVDAWHPWPMSQISAIYGTDDDEEILNRLYLIANNTAGLGLIHESQSIYSSTDYTRSWFAWANSYFAEMVLDLAQRKPGLIFRNDTAYTPGQ
ncbi:Six-hairpin glycosidase-like protein [Mycena alexandri]|uniref:Six-hairpin glycosidase-like protein n=1 Tax=Mycena alexandri TaxID=1745969 RepID=A0AAD6S9Z4_9AGAR|nr:Six-hairpin glycosidase-like protein [Mycena alexandri]